MSINIKKLIHMLPNCIQNKIFYYITLHPLAIAFKEDLKFYELLITNEEIKYYKKKIRYSYETKWIYKSYDFNSLNKLSINEIKLYISIKKILGRNREKSEYYLDNKYISNQICEKCEEVYIYNNVDKYCITCIKKIKSEYESIIPIDKTVLSLCNYNTREKNLLFALHLNNI